MLTLKREKNDIDRTIYMPKLVYNIVSLKVSIPINWLINPRTFM